MIQSDIVERLETEALSPYLHPDTKALLTEAASYIRALQATVSVYRIAGEEPRPMPGGTGMANFMESRRQLHRRNRRLGIRDVLEEDDE